MPGIFHRAVAAFLLASLVAAGMSSALAARKNQTFAESPLAPEQQAQLTRASRSMKSGKYKQAEPIIMEALQQSNDVSKCLAIAEFTERYAFPMLEVRRRCLKRALSLCQTREDYLLVALSARKYQMFEITRAAVELLIKNAKTVSELYDLARKAQEVALNDVAHLAMEKAYSGIKTVQDAIAFAKECKALGLDDLQRKTVKDIIDDEDDSRELCALVLELEPVFMRDQLRYCLRKALDKATSVGHMEDIRDLSRRFNEPDIANRAAFFARRGRLMQQSKQQQPASPAAAPAQTPEQRFGPGQAAPPNVGSGF